MNLNFIPCHIKKLELYQELINKKWVENILAIFYFIPKNKIFIFRMNVFQIGMLYHFKLVKDKLLKEKLLQLLKVLKFKQLIVKHNKLWLSVFPIDWDNIKSVHYMKIETTILLVIFIFFCKNNNNKQLASKKGYKIYKA